MLIVGPFRSDEATQSCTPRTKGWDDTLSEGVRWRTQTCDVDLGTSFGQRLIIRVLLQYMRGKQIEIKARPVIRIVE